MREDPSTSLRASHIRETLERNAKAVSLRPSLGLHTAKTTVRLKPPIDALEVHVEADFDSRGELGVSDSVPPGYTQVRYFVTVSSRASEADVRRVIDTADKYSPYRDVFSRAHDVRRELKILAPAD
jgi:hypothetical protein